MAKYGPKAKNKITKVMKEYERGELKSGSTGRVVKSRQQAVAIGISEARQKGYKVPPVKNKKVNIKKDN
ncbi:MAG: DUF6496 domain-containing protein [Patescibacteria group bacterium]